ncbi:MAG TPA: hypothetical protein VKH43_02950 [Thermoanaerobaculia bacterium]|nr:hypothetical protein [Thermoanaerobaculia bacterium]
MKKMTDWTLAAAAMTALLLSVPSSAKGQVAFQGTFAGPHGQFSIGIGSPAFPAGVYVPYPYVRHVYVRPGYGYGFYYGNAWVPVSPYGNRYIVVERPVVYGYGYPRYYRHYRYWDHGYWH